jgi:glycosyltransferase involved in cell wall biosynthesis
MEPIDIPASDGSQLISLILACYKHEKFVAEAIAGALEQTYQPLEIVIIDDGSPDQTATIISETLKKHKGEPAARFIRHRRNQGGRAAIEHGLRATTGDFVLFSSGDDVMLPEMVAEMAKVWREDDVSLVTTNALYIDAESRSLDRTHRDTTSRGDESFETLARDGGNVCCFGAAMGFEREIYTKFGWPPEHLGAFDIMLPFYAHLLKGVRFIEKPLLKYRVHSGNTSLTLVEENQNELGKLLTHERIYYQHIAHSLLMQELLDRLRREQAVRYCEVAERIMPLLTIQTVEMAKKLVKTRVELQQLGVALDGKQFGILPAVQSPERGARRFFARLRELLRASSAPASNRRRR